MPYDPSNVYLQSEAATVPRLKLVRMVYTGAIESLELALTRLEQKDRVGFVKSVGKAQELVAELGRSLDHEQGGEVARSLERLYEWMLRTLTPACLQGSREGVDEALRVLRTLQEGWNGIRDEELDAIPSPLA